MLKSSIIKIINQIRRKKEKVNLPKENQKGLQKIEINLIMLLQENQLKRIILKK